MTGLSKLLKYPSQLNTLRRTGGKLQDLPQKGRTTATMKNGSQHRMKDPVIMAKVRAALRSRFCSNFSCFRFSFDLTTTTGVATSVFRSIWFSFVRSSQLPRTPFGALDSWNRLDLLSSRSRHGDDVGVDVTLAS